MFSIGSEAIMCVLFVILGTILGGDQWRRPVLFVILGGDQFQPEILFPCLAFILAAVLSLVSCYARHLLDGWLERNLF